MRIKKVKELLDGQMASIREIGNFVGYNDFNYFTRVFKRTEGITPMEFGNNKMLT